MAKWFIIGGAGFIGSHLVQNLLSMDSNEVTVSDIIAPGSTMNIAPFLDKIQYKWKSVHDQNSSDFAGSDYVVFCAAQADAPLAISSPQYTFQQNVMGVLHILELLRNTKGNSKMLYMSSEDVYGAVPHDRIPIAEEEPLKPVNPYGVSKATADLLCQSYARAFGVPIVVLRNSGIYGPRSRANQVIPIFIRQALLGKDITIEGDGSQTKDFNYVQNVLDAISMAAKQGKSGEVYNIASEEEISILSLAEKIIHMVGSDSKIKFLPWREGERGLRTSLSTLKAHEVLGYTPRTSLIEGLERTIEWFRLTVQNRNER